MTARSDEDEQALDQAIAWHQALARDDADWDGYQHWLEADPRHRALFDEIALLDRVVDERADELRRLLRPDVVVPQHQTRGHRGVSRRWAWGGGAVAAAIAAAIAVPNLPRSSGDKVFETATGVSRSLALGEGESVHLAPASRLVLKGGDPRVLELARGEAYFSVTHDPARTLRIQAGDYAVTDIGTKFGINLAEKSVTVAVAEGHVAVAAAGGSSTRVGAGQRVVGRGGQLEPISAISAGDVSSWRDGRLVYDHTPLRLIADDLARYTGKRVTVDPAISEQQFSGVLSIGDGSRLFDNLSDLMAISYRKHGDQIRLVAGAVR